MTTFASKRLASQSARRVALVAAAALAAFALSVGCGDDRKVSILRVEIIPASADGDMPADGWTLRPAKGAAIPLRATGRRGDRGPVFEGDGPAGRYALLGPEPWALVGGPTPAAMQPDVPAVMLGVGRKYSVYLVAGEREVVGGVIARRPGVHASGGELVAFERADGPDRAVLRLRPDAWSGTLRVLACIGTSAFAYPMPIDLPPDGTPTGAPLQPAPTLPVEVVVIPAPPAGTAVGVEVRWEGLAVRQDAATDASGRAPFPTFPQTGDEATFRLGSAAWTPPFPDASRGDVRLVRPAGADSAGTVLVVLPSTPATSAPFVVQARSEDADSYGLVADVASAAPAGAGSPLRLRVPLARGRWRLWISNGEAGAIADAVDVRAGETTEVTPKLERLCRVGVVVEGGVPKAHRFTLECRRVEDGKAILAQGWVDRYLARSDLELFLPVGAYRLQLSDSGRTGRVTDLTLEHPSTRATLRLDPPR